VSEKRECPRCGSYVSEIYYEGHHEHCGWNCAVYFQLHAEAGRRGVGYVQFEAHLRHYPTGAELGEFRVAAAAAAQALYPTITVPDVSLTVWPNVNGMAVERDRLGPWWEPPRVYEHYSADAVGALPSGSEA
jgi:hypothetical protein